MDASSAAASFPIEVRIDPAVRDLAVGLVSGRGLTIQPAASSFVEWCARQTSQMLQTGSAGGDERRERVRAMLRIGGFKPSGRNKPAQEYLLRTATTEGRLPTILNVVDALNVVSLGSGLPISLLAAERLGTRVRIRYGCAEERFVFNRSGQELEVDGLICVCAEEGGTSQPLGTPIKDSMRGKVTEEDRGLLAVLYSPIPAVSRDELARWTHELAIAFREICPQGVVQEMLLYPPPNDRDGT
jgi:DNA/RNA-binding domain of Phe-tRNA-synthetase-like protein